MNTNWHRKLLGLVIGCAAAVCFCLDVARAGPWTEVGDAQLRSDIEILADAGVIDNVTMTWPIPWGGILYRLDQPEALDGQPDYVQDAARRVRDRGMAETQTDELRASLSVDGTNLPDVIRSFDALGRETGQGQVTGEYLWSTTALHLSLGAQTANRIDKQTFMPDGSYFAQRIGNAVVYAGYQDHWWGPGWISSMILSTNARPVPQVGFTRLDATPFQSPWLSWMGPWQFDFFAGVLDGPRKDKNTIYDGWRWEFSPFRHFEIAFSLTNEICGEHHPCQPIAEYFHFTNNSSNPAKDKDDFNIDIKYNGAFRQWAYQAYVQFMNQDGPNPVIHTRTSHLAGASIWFPVKGGIERLTVEYASSLATEDLWWGSTPYGFSYNDYKYTDGYRYRDRTLGFSLDDDSTLLSLQANFTDNHARSFTLTYHHATISDPHDASGTNVVTTAPVTLNMLDGRISLPLHLGGNGIHLDLDGRVQDDQPRPDKGFAAAGEVALRVAF